MELPLPHCSGELRGAAALLGGLETRQGAPGGPGSDVGWPLVLLPVHSRHRWCLLGSRSSFLGFPGCSPTSPGAPLLPAALAPSLGPRSPAVQSRPQVQMWGHELSTENVSPPTSRFWEQPALGMALSTENSLFCLELQHHAKIV